MIMRMKSDPKYERPCVESVQSAIKRFCLYYRQGVAIVIGSLVLLLESLTIKVDVTNHARGNLMYVALMKHPGNCINSFLH